MIAPLADADPLAIGGAAALAALVAIGIGWTTVRRRRMEPIGSLEDAADTVEAMLGGSRVSGAVVGADGVGALAVTDDGRVAAIRRRGHRLIAQEVTWRSVRSTAAGILIETGDRQLGEVVLAGVNALDIRRLAPKAKSR